MKKSILNKSIVVGIMLLFVGTCTVPCITGNHITDKKNNESNSVVFEGSDLLELLRPQMSLSNQPIVQNNNIGRGNLTLVTETYVGRVIEIDTNGTILWQKDGLIYPVDAERLSNGNTLISSIGEGVNEVARSGAVVWSYTALDGPWAAERLADGNTLITDTYSSRVIEVSPDGTIVWQYVNAYLPIDAERLSNGNTLISSLAGGVIEVDSDGAIQWQYVTGSAFEAERLANGNTLIAIYTGGVIEITSAGTIVWQKTGIEATCVQRLQNGNTLIASGYDGQVIEVDPSGSIVWEIIGYIGPFTAKRIPMVDILFDVTIQKGLGVTAQIKNIGSTDATNVQATITISDGVVFFNNVKTVQVGEIKMNTIGKALSIPIGFGKVTIEATVTCDQGGTGYANTTGMLLLF
ncbi:MAG: PQQ-binding-like beta-propeller repeat protein, partial [Thermoplasmatota archaeon]